MHCWQESKLVQPLWKTVSKFLKRLKVSSTNSTPGYLLKENKNTNWKRYMHPYVHCSIIYNCQDTEQDLPGGTVDKKPPTSAGDAGSIPGPRRVHVPRSDSAQAPQLLRPHSSAHVLQLLRSVGLEPVLQNRSLCSENPTHHNEEETPLASAGASPHKIMKTQHSQKWIK